MLHKNGCKLAVLMLTLSLTGCFNHKTSQEYYKLGQLQQQQNNDNAAIIQYKNSLRQDPKNINTRLALGMLYLEKKQLAAARKELSRVVKDPKFAAKGLIPLAMATSKLFMYQEVLELPLLSSDLPDQDMVIAHVLRGLSFWSLGQSDNAFSEYSAANAINQQAAFARLGQAMTASAKLDFEQARALTKSLLEQQPEMEEALILYGNLLQSNNEHGKAIEVYDKYIKLHGDRVGGIYLILVESLISDKQLGRAQAELEKLLSINSNHPLVNAQMARILFLEQDLDSSLAYAKVALGSDPRNFMANMIAGMSSFKLQLFEDSFRYLAKIESRMGDQMLPNMMQLINLIKRGDIEPAKQKLTQLPSLDSDNANLYILAANQFTIAQSYQLGLSLFEQVRLLQPQNNGVIFSIAMLKVKLKDPTALDDLAQIIYDPQLIDRVFPPLVKSFVLEKRIEQLLEIGVKLKTQLPDQPYGWEIPAIVAMFQNSPVKSEQLYLDMLQQFPQNKQALLALAKIKYSQNDSKSSLVFIDKLLEVEPKNYTAIEFKARVNYQQNKEIEQYKSVFKIAWRLYPDYEPLIIKMAAIHGAENQHQKGISLLQAILNNHDHHQQYWKVYGDLLLESGLSAQALTLYQQWGQQSPNSPLPLLKQIEIAERLGRYKDGIRLINQTRNKFGYLVSLQEKKISLLTLDNQLTLARELFNQYQATGKGKNNVYIAGLEGELFYRENKFEQAKISLLKAYEGTNRVRYLMTLSKVYPKVGLAQEGVDLLKKHLEKDPLNRRVKVLLAESYAVMNSPLAIESYQNLLESAPDNLIVLNNLAWSLAQSGQYEQALIHIEKAIKIQPRNAQLLDTYGVVLFKMSQHDKALIQFETGLKIAPNNSELILHNVELFIAMNKYNKAKRLLNDIENKVPPQFLSQYKNLKQQIDKS